MEGNVVVESSDAAAVCSLLWTTSEVLKTVVRYKKDSKRLRKAILKLHQVLKDVEASQQPDALKASSLLAEARVSASKSYTLAQNVAVFNFMKGVSYLWFRLCFRCCMACFAHDGVPDKFSAQVAETLKLQEDLSSSFKVAAPTSSDAQASPGSRDTTLGANKLELVTDKKIQQQITDGAGTVSIAISNSSGDAIYTVRVWRSNPEAEPDTPASYTLAASVECGPASDKKLDISLISTESEEQRASIACSGIMQAELCSYVDWDAPPEQICCCKFRNTRAGALLRRGRYVKKMNDDGLEYDVQAFTARISLKNLALEGLLPGWRLVDLEVHGTKGENVVFYECFVAESKEVLAFYIHALPKANHGTIHLLGIANQPALRDTIVAAFVALGLSKDL